MPAVLQVTSSGKMGKMGPQPNGGQTPPHPSVPASLQAGNTGSAILQKLSGMLGGGNPQRNKITLM